MCIFLLRIRYETVVPARRDDSRTQGDFKVCIPNAREWPQEIGESDLVIVTENHGKRSISRNSCRRFRKHKDALCLLCKTTRANEEELAKLFPSPPGSKYLGGDLVSYV